MPTTSSQSITITLELPPGVTAQIASSEGQAPEPTARVVATSAPDLPEPGEHFSKRPYPALAGARRSVVVPLSKVEMVCVQLGHWRGRDLIDTRTYIPWGKDEERATPKGFSCSPAAAREIAAAMIALADEFERGS